MGKPLPISEHRNPRGIPQAPFISKVTEYADNLEEANTLLGQLQEMTQKYKYMEMATRNRKSTLTGTIPSLKQTVESILFLQKQKTPFETQYALNDTVYTKAEVQPTQTVWLWLGASVMLEFPLDEAHQMMSQKVSDAEKGVQACEEDLEFLRENITVMEVNSARVINWQVAERKKGVSV